MLNTHSYFPYTSTYSFHTSQYKQKTQHPSHPLHKHTTYFNTPRLTPPPTTTAATQQTSYRLPHSHYNRHKIKTNMRHIHTSIVSRHLATRGYNKILRTPPPHIINPDEILPRLTRSPLAQLRTNKSPILKSYLHKVDAKSHPSPLCPLCNTHTPSLQLHHIVTPGFVDRTSWSDGAAGQMEGQAGWWTKSVMIGLPPSQTRVKGVGKQQQQS